MKRILSGFMLLLLACSSANAVLVSRSGGLAYYDTDTNLTWVADANLADTNDFGVAGINTSGGMIWTTAIEWTGAMNTAAYLGISNWRLPTWTDTGTPGCDPSAYTGTDCGFNVDLATGEMARMFYGTLGNTGKYDTSGVLTGCGGSGEPNCLTNVGPFENLQARQYFYGNTLNPACTYKCAWTFGFLEGLTRQDAHNGPTNVWAVSSGDSLAAVPVPPAVWLFGSALGVMGVMRRKLSS